MKLIRIHDTGLDVSPLCYGQAKLGVHPSEEDGRGLLDLFLALGGNFIDTAAVYSDWIPGETHRSERILGDYFKKRGNRDRFVICTKGCHYDLTTKADRVNPSAFMTDLDASLAALRTDHIDLYLFHRDDFKMPVSDLLDVCEQAKQQGKIRYYGSSNWRVQRLTAADKTAQEHGWDGFKVNQLTFHPAVGLTNPMKDDTMSMWNRNYANYHRETHRTVMANSVLAEGFLANPDDKRFKGSMYDTMAVRLHAKRIQKLSDKTGLTPAQVCIRYALDYPGIQVIPVFATANPERMRELFAALDKSIPVESLFRF